jgi:hypothetical protein
LRLSCLAAILCLTSSDNDLVFLFIAVHTTIQNMSPFLYIQTGWISDFYIVVHYGALC